jgi:uncharacterized membrane protein YdcZ (DUF606 family)
MTWGLLVIGILLAGALVDHFMPSAVAQRQVKATSKWSILKLSVGRRN